MRLGHVLGSLRVWIPGVSRALRKYGYRSLNQYLKISVFHHLRFLMKTLVSALL